MYKLALTTMTAVALLTIGGISAAAETTTPENYCVVSDIKLDLPCKDGDILVYDSHFASFLRTTSEEIAMVCDLSKPIVITGPDFICTFQKKTQEQFKDTRTEEAKKPKSIFR
ncbi:MAG: hypothetical protein LUC43_05555 [Burkholderiales bacterium]|nr:hypothetical protein [Burkholderiales bacterium]